MNPPVDDLLRHATAALAGEYEMVRPLGRGGMATVYLARERALKRLVAVKVLDPDLGASPIFRARFEREVESAAQLHHPHIVPIYRVGLLEGTAFYTMAYVEGESLADRMKREERLPPAEAVRIAREIAGALGAAHRRGIVHRDVKPQNVLLERESGRALVTDFGICRVVTEEPGEDADGDRLTGLGMVMGTPRYMSPEQAAGQRDITPASDLYSLGVLLYEMLAGVFPYATATPPNYMLAHVTGQPVPLVARVGDIPLALESVVMRLLAKEPADRFASADELVAALDAAALELPAAGPRRAGSPPRVRRGGRLRRAGIAALGAVAAAVIGVAALGRDDAPAQDPRRSMLVGFFQNLTGDTSLEWLRVGGVEYLSQSLGRWDDLTVVNAERLLDLARRAELPEGAPLSREDALRLARAAGVRTATIGTVLPLAGDTLRLTVRVYDVESGELLTTATARAVGQASLPGAFTSLADQILSIAGVPTAGLPNVEPPTRSIDAYRAYVEGIEARSRWDIADAVEAFRRAVAEDSSFALAYYELSQAVLAERGMDPAAPFVALADSALRWSAGRPEKERLLIEGFHALMHSDMPEARERYARLVALDSTIADAWSGLGDAAWLDMTLRRDAQGREYLASDFPLALRAYRRALALDGNDHRVYPQLANLLLGASLEQPRTFAGYREPPPGSIQTLMLRSPARFYTLLLIGDSLRAVPSESLTIRYSRHVVDSLRTRARAQARDVLLQWLSVAPDEGQAYYWLSLLQRLDRDYTAALRSLETAERLGTSSDTPFPLARLGLLLEARDWEAARRIGDSLLSANGGVPATPQEALTSGPLVNWLLASGRPEAAIEGADRYFGALSGFQTSERTLREYELVHAATALRVRSSYGLTDRAAVGRAVADIERRIAAAPEEEHGRLREVVARSVIASAAFTGDTALVRQWRALARIPDAPALDALAALLAGDRARAERLYVAAAADTSTVVSHFYGLGRTAEALDRPAEALRWYASIDSVARVGGTSGMDVNWPIVMRSYLHAGSVAERLGRTDEAIRLYRTVAELWRDAEPAVQEQRRVAAQALRELERADAGDR